MNEIESGVTYLHGTGGGTGDEKKVIFCVVRRTQGPQVEELVKELDPQAFMIIGNVNEVRGRGFSTQKVYKNEVGMNE